MRQCLDLSESTTTARQLKYILIRRQERSRFQVEDIMNLAEGLINEVILTDNQRLVLKGLLRRHPRPSSDSDIQDYTGIRRLEAERILYALQDQGYVTRSIVQGYHLWTLTSKGLSQAKF